MPASLEKNENGNIRRRTKSEWLVLILKGESWHRFLKESLWQEMAFPKNLSDTYMKKNGLEEGKTRFWKTSY